ncbi:unnamed protein product [Blepharisma stoltei]|uniref:Tyrosine-protein kinase ephrin type A/B receptor-like domain-containing protein n=1 Tax=Blepharisma stoltei TaxID=1481888 RepID=A0AAU9I8Z8_9CILI|nr:unnamed protein product [Blepharisma stoltei]
MDFYSKGNCLITFGGDQGISKIYNDVWEFSFSDYRWQELQAASQIAPCKRYLAKRYSLGGFIDSDGDSFYIFGGSTTNGPQNDMWTFDLINYQWTIISQNGHVPSPRSRFAYTRYNDKNDNNKLKFAIYGGTSRSGLDNNLFIFDVKSLNWSFTSPEGVSVPRLNSPTIQYWDGFIYLAGGQGVHGSAYEFNQEFFRYDLTNNKWENITNSSSPYGYRYLTGSAVYNNEFYLLFGWSDITGGDVKNIMKVNLLSSTYAWSTTNIVKDERWEMAPRDSFAFASHDNGTVYIFAGFISNNTLAITNSLVAFDLTASEITYDIINIEFRGPSPRKSHSLCAAESKLFLFGGQNGDIFYNDLWIFDPESDTPYWNSIMTSGNPPSARAGHAFDSQGDIVLVFGGFDGKAYLNDLFYLNLMTSTWNKVILSSTNKPTGRTGACMQMFLPFVFIFGGKTDLGVVNDLWLYNTGTNKFKLLYEDTPGTYPLPVYGHVCELASDSYNNVIFYTMFGSTDGELPVGNVDIYNMTLRKWINIHNSTGKGTARANAAVLLNKKNEIGVIGGQAWGTDPQKSIFILDLNTGITTFQNSLHDYFYSFAYFYYKKSFYIQGGGSVSGKAMKAFLGKNTLIKVELACDKSTNSSCGWTCSPGTYTKDNDCIPCPEGQYNPDYGATACTLCPTGTFNALKGSNSLLQCYPCEPGTYNSFNGSATCRMCPINRYCPAGSVHPLKNNITSHHLSIQPSLFPASSYTKDANDVVIIMLIVVCSLLFITSALLIGIKSLRVKLKKLDIYQQDHNYRLFEDMIRRSTYIGGLFSIIFFAVAVILICGQIIIYAKDNAYEDKSLVPLVALESELVDFPASISFEIILYRYGGDCVANDKCESSIYQIFYHISYSSIDINCKKIEGDCYIKISFSDCVISTGAYIEVDMEEKQSYTSAISVNLTSSSSIPGQHSAIFQSLVSDSNKIFRGALPSKFYFSVIPSLFKSYVYDWPGKLTGYHISYNTAPTAGSQYTIPNLPFTYNLKLKIILTRSLNSVYTQRFAKQTWFIVISGLLGSVFGAMGALRGFMKFSEKYITMFKIWRKNKRKRKSIARENNKIHTMMNLDEKREGASALAKLDITKTDSLNIELKIPQ